MGTSTNRPKPKPRQAAGKNGSGTPDATKEANGAAESAASTTAADSTTKTTTGALPAAKKASGALPATSKTPTAKTATGSTTGKPVTKAAPPLLKPPASLSKRDQKRDGRREELSRRIEERRIQREREQRNKKIRTGLSIGGGAAVVIAIIVGIIIFVQVQNGQPAWIKGDPIDGIDCGIEQFGTHYHAQLQIYVDGAQVPIPGNVGRTATSGCFYWLHVHPDTGDEGNIHIESPTSQTFTLHQFFDIWGNQQLSPTNLLGHKVDATHKLTVYVYNTTEQPTDSNTAFTVTPPSNLAPYTGDPSKITLKPHELIFLEYGTPLVPPSAWTFLAGL